MTDPSIVAQGYDAVYDAMPRSPTLLRLCFGSEVVREGSSCRSPE